MHKWLWTVFFILPAAVVISCGPESSDSGSTTSGKIDSCYESLNEGTEYVSRFLYTDVDQNTAYSGWLAAAFDSDGKLHAVIGRSDRQAPEAIYGTTRGEGCDMHTFAFVEQKHAAMKIDSKDQLHIAFAGAPLDGSTTAIDALTAVIYGTRSAKDDNDPWHFTELARNTFTEPVTAIAIGKDDEVVVVQALDDGGLKAFKSADGETWVESELPKPQTAASKFDVALDPQGITHVIAQYQPSNELTAYSETVSSWTSRVLSKPDSVLTDGFGFAIDSSGHWHLAMGNIGTPNLSGLQHGALGVLAYAKGNADELTWRNVGTGGQVRLALDDLGRVHISSRSRLLGTMHTILDGEKILRSGAVGSFETFQPPMLTTGPRGRVALGSGVGFYERPPAGSMTLRTLPVMFEYSGDTGGQVVVEEYNKRCSGTCTLNAPLGKFIEVSAESVNQAYPDSLPGEPLPYSNSSLTQVVKPDGRDQAGTGLPVPDGPVYKLKFQRYPVTKVTQLSTPEEDWHLYNLGNTLTGPALAMTHTTSTPQSQIRRWSAAGVELDAIEIDNWYTDNIMQAVDGSYYILGRTHANSVIGQLDDFAVEDVLVKIDSTGEVQFVERLTAGSVIASTLTSFNNGVAFVVRLPSPQVVHYDTQGQLVFASTIPLQNTNPFLAANDDSLFYMIPDETTSYFVHLSASGEILKQKVVGGVVKGMASDSQDKLLVAQYVLANTILGSELAGTEGHMLMIYNSDGSINSHGPVVAGETLKISSAIRLSDDELFLAGESPVRSLVTYKLGIDANKKYPVYAGVGSFATTGGTLDFVSMALAGEKIVIGALAGGSVDFKVGRITTEAYVPVLLDVNP